MGPEAPRRKGKVGVATVRRFETGAQVEAETVEAIVRALNEAGVAFLGPGRLALEIKEGVALTAMGRPLARPPKRVYKRRGDPANELPSGEN